MTTPELEDFWDQPVDWESYREIVFSLLPNDRRGEDVSRRIHGPGLRQRPQPKPVKVKKSK
jgi:hypothetical protein